jgi:hypothetical protein
MTMLRLAKVPTPKGIAAGAGRHQHLAGRVESDHGALERADARALHVRGDAHTAIHFLPPERRLLAANRLVAGSFKRRLKGGVEVPAVMDKRVPVPIEQRDVVRHLVGANEVAPAHLGGIDPA